MPRRQNGSITRLADGRWMVRITIPATATAPARRPHRITESKNRKEAERLLRELQAEAEVAGADAAEIYKPRAATTLAEYVSGRYAASLDADVAASRLRARTAEEYLSVLKLRVLPLYGHRMVSSLTAADADVLAERVRSKGLSLNTVRRAVECFRRLIKLAEKDAIVPRGTTAMIELPPAKVMQEPKRITPEEARRLLAVLLTDAAKGEPRALTALLATYGGLRTSEALGVRWASVDLAAATAQIVEGITELRDGRLVVGDPKTRLSTPTLHCRHRWSRCCGTPAVHGRSAPGSARPSLARHRARATTPRYLRASFKAAGLAATGAHELRRGFADAALDAGSDLLAVSRALGHSDVRLLSQIYAGRRPSTCWTLAKRSAICTPLSLPPSTTRAEYWSRHRSGGSPRPDPPRHAPTYLAVRPDLALSLPRLPRGSGPKPTLPCRTQRRIACRL